MNNYPSDPFFPRTAPESDNETILSMLTNITGISGSQITDGFSCPFPDASPHSKTLLFLYGLLLYNHNNDKYCRQRMAVLEDILKKMMADGLPAQNPEKSENNESIIQDVVDVLIKMSANLDTLSQAQTAKEPLSAEVFRDSLEKNFDSFAACINKAIAKANFTAGILPMLGCLFGGAALGFIAAKFL